MARSRRHARRAEGQFGSSAESVGNKLGLCPCVKRLAENAPLVTRPTSRAAAPAPGTEHPRVRQAAAPPRRGAPQHEQLPGLGHAGPGTQVGVAASTCAATSGEPSKPHRSAGRDRRAALATDRGILPSLPGMFDHDDFSKRVTDNGRKRAVRGRAATERARGASACQAGANACPVVPCRAEDFAQPALGVERLGAIARPQRGRNCDGVAGALHGPCPPMDAAAPGACGLVGCGLAPLGLGVLWWPLWLPTTISGLTGAYLLAWASVGHVYFLSRVEAGLPPSPGGRKSRALIVRAGSARLFPILLLKPIHSIASLKSPASASRCCNCSALALT